MTVTGMPALNAVRSVVDAPPGMRQQRRPAVTGLRRPLREASEGHDVASRYPFPAVPDGWYRISASDGRRPRRGDRRCTTSTGSSSSSGLSTARSGSSTRTARTSGPIWGSAARCAATASSARSTAGGSTATDAGRGARPRPPAAAGVGSGSGRSRAQRSRLRLVPRRRRATGTTR